MTGEQRTQKCPGCAACVTMAPYDIGSGPEMACPHCECCWGADGQPLQPWTPYSPPPRPFTAPEQGPREDVRVDTRDERAELIAAAAEIHDGGGCGCDPRYLMSCPTMAAAILQAGRHPRAAARE